MAMMKKTSGKMMTEKKTGEKYKSKVSMMKHEKGENMKEMIKEYGAKLAMKKMANKSKKK